MKPTVIVATEVDSVVRIYIGHAENGGMDQVGQFTTNRPIDPTELVNTAVELTGRFRWLNGDSPDLPSSHLADRKRLVKVEPKALPPAKPKRKNYHTNDNQLWRQQVACPVAGCHHTARRNNMTTHLQGGRHGWAREKANRTVKELPRLVANANGTE